MDTLKIGEFIKSQRTQLGMTQKELADKIGCTDKAISRWETGKGMPDVSLLIPLSNELNITLNELLSGERIVSEELIISDEISEIIEKGDEVLMNVMEESQKTVKRHKKISISLLILFILQMMIFFVFPNFLSSTQDPIEFIVITSGVIFAGVGLIKNKWKWLFPILLYAVFVVYDIFRVVVLGNAKADFPGIIGFYAMVYAFLVMGLTSLVMFLVGKIKERKFR